MISIAQREHANGYLDAMTPNERFDCGEDLFRQRRAAIVAAENNRKQVEHFDERAMDAESQAADRRANLIKRRTDAEVRRVEAEIAIKKYIIETAEIYKAELAALEAITK